MFSESSFTLVFTIGPPVNVVSAYNAVNKRIALKDKIENATFFTAVRLQRL